MIYAKTNLVLVKRYDFFTMFLTKVPLLRYFASDQTDTLWIDIPIERAQEVHSEILLVQAKELNDAKEAQPHIEKMLQVIKPNTCSTFGKSSLICLGDNQESVDSLFSD